MFIILPTIDPTYVQIIYLYNSLSTNDKKKIVKILILYLIDSRQIREPV